MVRQADLTLDIPRLAIEAYYRAIENGLRCFNECGVATDRMALVIRKATPYTTELHVDGISRMEFVLCQPNYSVPRHP